MTQNVRPGGLPVVAQAARGREAARRSLAQGGLLVVARRSPALGGSPVLWEALAAYNR